MNHQKEIKISITPYPGFYKSAVAISFDYETSAVSGNPGFYSTFKKRLLRTYHVMMEKHRDLSGIFGRGYANRLGAENIIGIFQKYRIHGTWFSTGHVLLKGNKTRDAFRINQTLPYATREAGFPNSMTWRRDIPTFSEEPYGNYKKYPYWYMGDQSEKLRSMGEDIQCHTFSHPFMALESIKNIRTDISDWQSAALRNGFKTATILAFPYSGDTYRYYYNLRLKAHPGLKIRGQPFRDINLADPVLRLLEQNGIELVTRCISRIGKSCNTGFIPYENSNLFYMSEINFNPGIPEFESLRAKINGFVKKECALNIWMHPNNVFYREEVENFEKLVKLLNEGANKTHIWMATISEIWEHFKKTTACQVHIQEKRKKPQIYEAQVCNGNNTSMENLGMKVNASHANIINPDRNIACCKNRISIGKLMLNQTYRFKFCVGM
jgi:hypothetical protein